MPLLCMKIDTSVSNNVTVTAHLLPGVLYVSIDEKQYALYRATHRLESCCKEEESKVSGNNKLGDAEGGCKNTFTD